MSNYKKTVLHSCLLAMMLLTLISCKKEFLNTVPDKSVLIPSTLDDFQAILDNTSIMNTAPEIGLIASDDYYTTSDGLEGLYTQTEKNSYLWARNVYQGEAVADWNSPYQQIFYCNVVLDGLNASNEKKSAAYNGIKGAALFFRGFALYNLSQVFAAPYDSASVASLPGLPVRLSSDVNIKSVRGTLKETYDQLLADVKSSAPLLPAQSSSKNRPNKGAAYALLARIYLAMGKYGQAGTYADSSLLLNNKLMRYSAYNPVDYRPFPLVLPNNNDEVYFDASPLAYSFDESPYAFVDSALYRSYSDNDLRKTLYFSDQGNGGVNFQGSYSGNYLLFSGLTTDEIYLIKSEVSVRSGNIKQAMDILNALLVTRFKEGTYVPYTANSPDGALSIVLTERRKELFSRGLRFSDLRRLNTDPRFAVTLKRSVGGQIYTLPPLDKRYVFPIPDEEINSSRIPQNDR